MAGEKSARLERIGLPVLALDDKLKAQVEHLDEHEVAALEAIKRKLNSGLADKLRQAADTVGGFVW